MSTKLIKRCDRCQEEVEEFGTVKGSDSSNHPILRQPLPLPACPTATDPNSGPRYSLSRVTTYPQQAPTTPVDLCDRCSQCLHLFLKGCELQ